MTAGQTVCAVCGLSVSQLLIESLAGQRDLFRAVIAKALEDFVLTEAIE